MADVTVTLKLSAPQFKLLEEVFDEAAGSLDRRYRDKELSPSARDAVGKKSVRVVELRRAVFS